MGSARQEGIGGRLEGLDFTDVVRALSRDRKTGILQVVRESISNRLCFEDGRLIFAASSDPNQRLGELLLRQGKVTVSQLEVALAHLGTGKRIGTLMCEAGILTPQELHAAVLEQVKATFFVMLAWTEGRFSFEEGPLPTDEPITLQAGIDELLLQGIRSVRSWTRIERGAGPAQTIYALTDGWQDRADRLALNLSEKLVLEHLADGEGTLEQLCREISLSSFEIHRTLWAFTLVGLAETSLAHSRRQGPDEGELSETSFAELIIRLNQNEETGVIYVRSGPNERSFHVNEGRLVFATSNSADDGLVTYLYRRGMISLADQNETARRLLSNKRVGTILREMGVIDDQDLNEMVRLQVAEIVYDTIGWEHGGYLFVRGALPTVERTTLELDLGQIVAEGIRRIGSWTRVVRGCGGMDNPLCLKPEFLDVLDRMGAGVPEWEVVSALKRPQTPRRVCSLCNLGDFRICQILWTLKLLGGLEDSPIELAETAPPVLDVVETAGATVVEMDEPEPSLVAAEIDLEIDLEPTPTIEVETRRAEVAMEVEIEDELEQAAEEASQPTFSAAGHDEDDLSWALSRFHDPIPEPSTESVSFDAVPQPEPEPAPAPGPVRSPMDLPAGMDDFITRFNAMHRIVYGAVRSEVGAGATNFVRSCCLHLRRESTDPVEGVELHSDGSWDAEGLKEVVQRKHIADPWQSYQQVLDSEFLSLEPLLGQSRADKLKQRIWQIERAGAAG